MRVPFRGLGQIGLISDAPAVDLPPAALTDAINIDLSDKAIRKSPGWVQAFSVPNAVWMETWFGSTGGNLLYIDESGLNPAFYVLNALGGFDDVTNGELLTNGNVWDSTGFGESVVFTNGSDVPYSFTSGGAAIASLLNWPALWRTEIIRPYQNFLIALRVTKSGVENVNGIQWSNAADNNVLPPDWDEANPASLAAGATVNGDAGPIIDGLALDKSFLIYQSTGCSALSFTGGQYVMNLRPLHNRGLLSRHAVCQFDKMHFCIGQGVIYVNTGAGVQHMAEDKVQTRFFNELYDEQGLSCFHDPVNRRVLTFYRDSADATLPNRVLKWDYSEDAWTFDDFTTTGVIRAKYGPTSERGVTWESIDLPPDGTGTDPDAGATWNDYNTSWAKTDTQLGDIKLQMLVDDGAGTKVVVYEDVNTRNTQQFDCRFEREYIDFDDLLQGQLPLTTEHIKHIKTIHPQVTGNGKLYFQFGFAKSANLATQWGPEVEYNLDSDYKVDFRQSGRYFAWRCYTKTTIPTDFRLSGFDIEVELAGER